MAIMAERAHEARAVLAVVMGMAVLDELFDSPDEPRPARDAVVQEMTTLLVHGLKGRADTACAGRSTSRRRKAT